MSFLNKLFESDPIKPLWPLVGTINDLEKEFENKSQQDLRNLTTQWQGQIKELSLHKDLLSSDKESKSNAKKQLDNFLESILAQAFAAVREAAKRTLNQRHFDVQLLGGITLHKNNIAEMKTGEGKTLSSTTAVYLNALAGYGVHVVTVNDYLARRDASWMGQIYDYLGLTVGVIQHAAAYKYEVKTEGESNTSPESAQQVQLDVKNLTTCGRRDAYHCDITYGTNNEYGFDYLRDNMAPSLTHKVQHGHFYAIVDEVDSILIDEARTPLIISAPDTESTDKYRQFSQIVNKLTESEDYNVDHKKRSATLTDNGIAKIEKLLGVENIYVERGIIDVHHIEQALRAKTLFKRDHHYVVRENQITIVDEFTGRLMPGRRFSEGLHQAIEAKENVTVQRESKTLATITFQNYFRLYTKIAGMTGTAKTEEEEFRKIYGLDVYVIPTNKPIARKDEADLVFKTEKGKFEAIVREVKVRNDAGQPVLIGTVSIEKNEEISKALARAGIRHDVLNAKNHEQEALIIAQAGRARGVTLATNIAGRGVDIILGGSPFNAEDAEKVKEAGGLHVLGTERHESRRIDNQLRGRSGRQGDPGSTQFFVSLEDDLIKHFGGERVGQLMTTMGIADDVPIEHNLVSRVIESAQKKIEGLNFDVRKHVLEFDDVMNKHREVIYRVRDRALAPDANLKEEILEKVEDEIGQIVQSHLNTESGKPDIEGLEKSYLNIVGKVDLLPLFKKEGAGGSYDPATSEELVKVAKEAYEQKEKQMGADVMRAIERAVILRSIDSLWMEHIDTMEHLRSSVRLRGYAQKDPLIEYKREGYTLFERLLAEVDKGIVYAIYKVQLQQQPHQHTHTTTHSSAPAMQTGLNQKIGRNQIVTVQDPKTGDKQQMKYKKAESKIQNGWRLISVDS